MPGLGSVVAAILVVLLRWGTEEVSGSVAGALAFVGAALGATLLAGAALARRARARPIPPRALLLFRLAPLAIHALAIHAFHWSRVVEAIGVARIASLGMLASLVPFFALQGIVWARAWSLSGTPASPVRAALDFHYRSAALALAPFLLYAGAFDALDRWRAAAILLETWRLGAWLSALAFFVLLALGFPFLVRWIWRTRPLERGPLRERLDSIARGLGFRGREILVWDTGGLAANAAVVGLVPAARYVVLTDALLHLLPPREVEAVFGHEIGHARCRHAASLFAYAGAWLLVVALVAGLLPPLPDPRTILAAAAGLLAFWHGFGYLARRFELEADLFGAAAVGDAALFAEALERVGSVSGRSRWHGSWRHFSVAKRVAFLASVAADPSVGKRLRERLRRIVRVAAAVVVGAGAIHLVEFTARSPGEIGVAALRLGRFEESQSWLARAAPTEVGPRAFLELARLGATLEEGSPLLPLFGRAVDLLAWEDLEGLRRFLEEEGGPLLGDDRIGALLRDRLDAAR